MNETGLVVRRRAGLMAAVAVAALALSVAYLWRFADTGAGVSLLVGVALGLVAVFHGLAWRDARTPLLVADETGIRVRLGRRWRGIPWSHVERVEVDRRGRVRDGHVSVLTVDAAGGLDGVGWRARLGAATNRWFYDAPLVVPYGLTTIVSVVDVSATLERLADGRAPVLLVDEPIEEPEPTVTLTSPADDPVDREPSALRSAEPEEAEPVEGAPDRGVPVAPEPTVPEPVSSGALPAQPAERPRRTRRSLIPGREPSPALPLAKVVAALRSHPARREEVTLPAHHEPTTVGTLALSEPYADVDTQPLPEIEHLRRHRDRAEDRPEGRSDGNRGHDHDPPMSNVGLIIDATTDLSARAMSKVRRGGHPAAADVSAEHGDSGVGVVSEAADLGDLVIGGDMRAARVHLGLSVDELAERTRIRPYVIESVEVDDFRPCGGDFYARGHLRMLARVLGMDAEPLLTAYDEQFATSPVDPRAVFDAGLATGTSGMIRDGASGARWGGLLAAVLVLVLVWGVARYFADDTTPAVSDVVPTQNSAGLGSPGPGNKPLPPPASATARVRLAAVGGDSRVVVKNRRGRVVFHGVLADGQVRMVRGIAPLHVMAVDGGVIRLGAGGHTLGFMGAPGVKSRRQVPAATTTTTATKPATSR